jgi:HSP20 family protein
VSLRAWDPYRDFMSLRENINRMFEDTVRGIDRPTEMSTSTWPVPVDIYETKDEIVVRLEAAGINPKEVKIHLIGDQLTITGKREHEGRTEDRNYVRVERRYGQFVRSFTLNVPVKAEAVNANYKDGLLEVHLPKADQVKPKEIQVNVE